MAIVCSLFCALDRNDLKMRLKTAAREAAQHWPIAVASDLGRFDREILADYGLTGDFKSYAYVKLDKDLSVPARRKLKLFFRDLPGPKVVLFDGDMMDQDEFRRIPPEGDE